MKQLRRWAVVLLLWTAAGCSGVKGSGKSTTDSRAVGPFSEVEVSSVIKLRLTLGKKQSVVLDGDHNLLPLVTTQVHGSRLVIKPKETIRPKVDLVATVTAEDVTVVRTSGASDVRIDGVDNERLRLEVSGAGDAELSGRTRELSVELSGAGDVDAHKLDAKTVDLRVSGAGSVEVGAPDTLDVDISGAASVRYRGNPKITKRISGAGTLKRR